MTKTIEQQVADIILQRETEQLEIDGRVYRIGQPSVATLIMVSEIISTLPKMERVDKDKRLYAILHTAKDYGRLGDIAATLVLGAKAIRQERRRSRRWYNVFRKRRSSVETLGEKILENLTSKQLLDLVITRLTGLDVTHFFVVTTSLSEANILAPTKEVGQEATQSGLQS